MYVIENVKFMKENNLEFHTFMDAFKYQQKHCKDKKIFETKGTSTKRLTKLWDPIWEYVTFYKDDPICPKTKKS